MKKLAEYIAIMVIGTVALVLVLGMTRRGAGDDAGLFGMSAVRFAGEYSADGGEWTALGADGLPGGIERAALRGHFDKSVPAGQRLMLKIHNLRLRLCVNGEEVYAFGWGMAGATGHAVAMVDVSGLMPEDDVEFVLENAMGGVISSGMNTLLGELALCHGDEPYKGFIDDCWAVVVLSIFILLVGVCALFASVLFRRGGAESVLRIVAVGLFAITAGTYIFADGCIDDMALVVSDPLLCNLLDMLPLYLIYPAFAFFVRCNLRRRRARLFLLICAIVDCAGTALALALTLAGRCSLYSVQGEYIAVAALTGACAVVLLVREARENADARAALIVMLPSVIALNAELVNVIHRFVPTRTLVPVGLALTVLLQLWQAARITQERLREQERLVKLEKEMLEGRVAVMLSQIQPHFLYNALGVVQGLCRENPELAEKATIEFTEFLRGNMDSLSSDKPITFERELDHTRHYLSLEKLRFADRLSIVYDIQSTAFRVPTLTLQPIVENAVRYGVCKRVEGGKVEIASAETDAAYVITVRDDGVGFDPDAMPEDGRSHIGIANVRERLSRMCGGTLEITSAMGEGTVAVITIPKEREKSLPRH